MESQPTNTRCKVQCRAVTKLLFHAKEGQDRKFVYNAEFSAVYGGSAENEAFFAATPSLTLNMQTLRDDQFVPGQFYYLDFSPAAN